MLEATKRKPISFEKDGAMARVILPMPEPTGEVVRYFRAVAYGRAVTTR